MVRLILALSCFVIFFGNIGLNEASSEVPYWAGHKAKLYAETPFGAHECELTIEYTSDGKHYSASLEIPTSQNAVGGGSCRGLVDKEGNLERKDCTPGQWAPRTLAGTVTKPILESEHASSTSGGCKWADKTLQKKHKTINSQLDKPKRKNNLSNNKTKDKQTGKSKTLLLEKYKTECLELGFAKGTEKFGDCVMKLINM